MPVQESLVSAASSVGKGIAGIQSVQDQNLERAAKEARLLKTMETTEKQVAQAELARNRSQLIQNKIADQKEITELRKQEISLRTQLNEQKLAEKQRAALRQDQLTVEKVKQQQAKTKILQDKAAGIKPQVKQLNIRTKVRGRR